MSTLPPTGMFPIHNKIYQAYTPKTFLLDPIQNNIKISRLTEKAPSNTLLLDLKELLKRRQTQRTRKFVIAV